MPLTAKQELGQWGEEEATKYLQDLGYKIAERNFKIRSAEIDIIAWHDKYHHGRTLCFVEVKTRSLKRDSAERATDKNKLQHIMKAAKAYCIEQGFDMDKTPIQFEHVSVYGTPKQGVSCRNFVIPVE